MIITGILARDNELMAAGKLDEQIIHDFDGFIKDRISYQEDHLDKKLKVFHITMQNGRKIIN